MLANSVRITSFDQPHDCCYKFIRVIFHISDIFLTPHVLLFSSTLSLLLTEGIGMEAECLFNLSLQKESA
jgi:hypothetical protein